MMVALSVNERRKEAYLFEFEADKPLMCYYFGPFSSYPAVLVKEMGKDRILDRLILFDLSMRLRKYIFEAELDEDAISEIFSDSYRRIINNLDVKKIPIFALFNELRWAIYKSVEKFGLFSFKKLLQWLDLKFLGLSLKDLEEGLKILEIANLLSIESVYGEPIVQLERKISLYLKYEDSMLRTDNWRILEIPLDPQLTSLLIELRRRKEIPESEVLDNPLLRRLLNLNLLRTAREGILKPVEEIVFKIVDITGEIIMEERV